MSNEACKVCGLRQDQLPPIQRFYTIEGEMLCRHPFGTPAQNVPDWRTRTFDGTPYTTGVEQFMDKLAYQYRLTTIIDATEDGQKTVIVKTWDDIAGHFRFIRIIAQELHPAYGEELIKHAANS